MKTIRTVKVPERERWPQLRARAMLASRQCGHCFTGHGVTSRGGLWYDVCSAPSRELTHRTAEQSLHELVRRGDDTVPHLLIHLQSAPPPSHLPHCCFTTHSGEVELWWECPGLRGVLVEGGAEGSR